MPWIVLIPLIIPIPRATLVWQVAELAKCKAPAAYVKKGTRPHDVLADI